MIIVEAIAGTFIVFIVSIIFAALAMVSYEVYKLIKFDRELYSVKADINKKKSTE